MYRRYSQASENPAPVSNIRRNRIKNIIILALAAGLAVTVYVCLPAVQKQNGARELYIQRMQNEVTEAVRLGTSLSRNGGADSSSILARIRCSISSVKTVNEISMGINGVSGRLIKEETLSSLISYIDNYLNFLTTGMDTGEYQTNLQNNLLSLQGTINSL